MAHIFISYSHKDSEYAHRLADILQEKGFNVWIDARLDYGSQWPVELQKQLDTCDAFILIMSSHAYSSEWVQSELQRARRKLKPIFPLLLEGDETWLSVESTQYYDVRGGKIPDKEFYADISSVVPPSPSQVIPFAADEKGLSLPGPVSSRAKSRRGAVLTIFGIIAALGLAVVILGAVRSRSETPPSGGNAVSPSTEAFSNPVTGLDPATATSAPAQNTPVPRNMAVEEIVDSQGVPMRFVPAGNFMAGSDSGYENEKPVHTVYLDDFYIDKYEVTNALFKACVDAGECQPPQKTSSMTRESYFGNPEFEDYPVIYVSWENARDYCQWRGRDLPTEAQWEKAARGVDGRVYPWGNEIDPAFVNYNDYVGDTTKVGSYEGGKSPYGVYDMAGNAWEWVADWYSETYYQDTYDLNTPLTNPTGPRSGEYKVLRGGSWHDDDTIVTTSNRGWSQLEYFENTDFGFRCATSGSP
jgi:formylglycine-generating enzyme required for sulfatase activity